MPSSTSATWGCLPPLLHVGVEAFRLGVCFCFFRFTPLALDDHSHRAPQRFAAPGVAGAAEQAGVEVVEGVFQFQVVVAEGDETLAVLLSGPELEGLAGSGWLVS